MSLWKWNSQNCLMNSEAKVRKEKKKKRAISSSCFDWYWQRRNQFCSRLGASGWQFLSASLPSTLTHGQQTVQLLAQMQRALCCALAPWVEGTRQTLSSKAVKIREERGGWHEFTGRVKSSDFNTDRKFIKFFLCCMCCHQGGCWRPG